MTLKKLKSLIENKLFSILIHVTLVNAIKSSIEDSSVYLLSQNNNNNINNYKWL